MKTLYLAHSFQCLTKVRQWQLMMQGKYNLNFKNPFFNNPHENIEDLQNLKTKKSLKEYLRNLTIEMCYGIVENDLELIRKSDGLVSYFDYATIGTCQEIIMAAYVYHIPVYIITKKDFHHPWLRTLADFISGGIFKTRSDFKKYVEQTWGKKE